MKKPINILIINYGVYSHTSHYVLYVNNHNATVFGKYELFPNYCALFGEHVFVVKECIAH